MSFVAGRPAFRCPTLPEVREGLFALLPRGRAWQTHEIGPAEPVDAAFDDSFDPEAFQVEGHKGSILWRFWTAMAAVLVFVNARWCDLRLEFWCASMLETRDQWMAEYGLPDPCDPFPDLCAKVAALGGTRCEYFASIAIRAGWSVTCRDWANACGARAGCSVAGAGRAGASRGTDLIIVVDIGDSSSFGGRMQTPPLAGRLRAGLPLACPPDLGPLMCIMERIVPAHVTVRYVTQ